LVPDATARRRYVEMVKPTQDAKHGDYQANCAMSLAKEMGKKPREAAEEIVKRLPLSDMLEPPQIAGPGFINLTLKPEWLAKQVAAMAVDERLGVAMVEKPKTYVIDYSSPNVAKPLHVGHLRSTIIGDALKRILQFLGHKVIADNHLGDWGTQFGMLLYGYKHFLDRQALEADPVKEMVRLYLKVRSLTKGAEDDEGEVKLTPEEAAIAEACRQETAKLQAGDPENKALWEKFMPWCMGAITPLYERLEVSFDCFHGESFYNGMMPSVVDDFLSRGIAQISRDAVVIFPENNPEATPVVIRKKDGAFTYMASDLATIRDRVEEWHPDALLYVVGTPQSHHFQRLFDAARRWGYRDVEFQHIAFGSILGNDKRVLSTRNGGAEELVDLLDAAVARGGEQYEQNCAERRERGQEVPDLSPEEKRRVAERVGMGAVKYADLLQNRLSDYVFDWNKMLATDGNSATYMQYAYARNQSIFRKGEIAAKSLRQSPSPPSLATPHERALAVQLIRFGDAVQAAAAEYMPHVLTAYLWDLTKTYSGFFEHCPVLKAESPELKAGRLLLCDLTARTIQQTLLLIGIRTVDRM
jgi:arginyl-tRNA synthetase